ncbi:MAG: membrane protein insertion efficiency factor YidD [Candidatus Daviesbacteria bacterium]|nr:membrane protein insertion efficiency factor YidD [Candidatus Daviesbacteria bacterium]
MKKILIYLIDFYQSFLSFDGGILAIFAPGGACRYEIRCSEYTKQMIVEQGVLKGLIMGIKRIWSCR